MRRWYILIPIVFLGLMGIILYFGMGIRFGKLKCKKFKYDRNEIKCGSVVEFSNGLRKFVIKIDSIKYLNNSLEINYFYNLSSNHWWSKFVYLRGRAISSEENNYYIRVALISKPVVESLAENILSEDFVTVDKFKKTMVEKFEGKVETREAILTLIPPFDFVFWQKNRFNTFTEIIFAK